MPSGNGVRTGLHCSRRNVLYNQAGYGWMSYLSTALCGRRGEERRGEEKCGRSTDSQHTAHLSTLCLSSKIFSVWIQVDLAHCRCDLLHQLTDIDGIRDVQAFVSTSVPPGEVMKVSVRTRSIYEQLNECSAANDCYWIWGVILCHMKWAGFVSIGAIILK
jgi:hypothetical protein